MTKQEALRAYVAICEALAAVYTARDKAVYANDGFNLGMPSGIRERLAWVSNQLRQDKATLEQEIMKE